MDHPRRIKAARNPVRPSPLAWCCGGGGVNCYLVNMTVNQVELLAPNAATAALSAMELYPSEQVLSVILEPEWEESDD